ncbi:hypothetical protein D3C75_1120360 [compost metagenome]
MQSITVTASSHQTAGEFIDNDNLVLIHYIINVTAHNYIRLERLYNVMIQRDIAVVIQVLNAKSALSRSHTLFGQSHGFHFNINGIILFRSQSLHETVCRIV